MRKNETPQRIGATVGSCVTEKKQLRLCVLLQVYLIQRRGHMPLGSCLLKGDTH